MTDLPPSDPPAAPQRPPPKDAPAKALRGTPAMAGFLGGLIGGIAATALAAGALVAAWPMVRSNLVPVPTHDSSEAMVAALASRVAVLEGAANRPAPSAAGLAELEQRLSTLERAEHVPAEDPRIAALSAKADQLAEQVASLHAASGDVADMQRLVTRAEAAAQSAHDAAAHRQTTEALLIVAGQLRDAVERGTPYAVELAAARRVIPSAAAPALDTLSANADTGIPRLNQLSETFPAVAAAIARAALAPPDAEDFWGKLKHEAATLVSIRRTDGQGPDPDAIAARAEKAVRAGDLSSAVNELGALQGAPAEAAAAWLAAAKSRLAAEHALSDLAAASAAALAADNG